MKEILVALDLGSSRVSAAMAKFDDLNKMQIAAVTSVKCSGLKKSVVVDLEKTVEAISQCKSKLENKEKLKINEVYVSFPAGLCEIIESKATVTIPSENKVIRNRDIEKAINDAVKVSLLKEKEIVDIVPLQYIIGKDQTVNNPLGMKAEELTVEIQIYTAERKTVFDFARCIERAGLSIERIIVQPLAIAALIKQKENEENCSAIVNVGAETIDVSVFQGGGIYHTASLPIGGSSITKDISQCFNLSFEEAEKLKLQYHYGNKDIDKNQFLNYDSEVKVKNIDFKLLDEVIKARVEELLSMAFKELTNLKFYNYINDVYVVGGGIVHYRDIIEDIAKGYDKSIKYVESGLAAAVKPIYTVPIGLLKYVEEDTIKKTQTESVVEASNDESNKEPSGVINRIKNFLQDIF